jgi:hypothetical protein
VGWASLGAASDDRSSARRRWRGGRSLARPCPPRCMRSAPGRRRRSAGFPQGRAGWVHVGVPFPPACPTAKQDDARGHAAPARKFPSVSPRGSCVAASRQRAPFHCTAKLTNWPSALTYPPTAEQRSTLAHETPNSPLNWAPVGLGDGSTCHADPVNRSTSVPPLDPPTATQSPPGVHDAPLRNAKEAPSGAGVDNSRQRPSRHCSLNGTSVPELSTKSPTARQADFVHAIPPSSVNCAPGGAGTACRDHETPFQRSTSDPASVRPTAKHDEDERQPTANNVL